MMNVARRRAATHEAAEWFAAHRASALTEEERSDFVAWLRASPDHVGEYLAFAELEQELKAGLGHSSIDTAELLERAACADDVPGVTMLEPYLRGSNQSTLPAGWSRRAGIKYRQWRRLAQAAGMVAAALLLALIANLWWQYTKTNFSTGHAEQRSLRLPDGTLVHLNSSSRIRIAFDDKERRVFLVSGQATFHVAKDAVHPFVVRTGDAVVRAVGTEFDVYRQSAAQTVVSVMEGRVAVAEATVPDPDILTAKPLFLEVGQQASVDSGPPRLLRDMNGVSRTVAWLQNKVAFDHDTLAYAAQELNRYNDLQLVPMNSEAAALQISGTFGAYDAESFVKFLEHQPGIVVVKRGQKILITSAVHHL